MKKIWLIAGSLLFAVAVNAQQQSDTTSTQREHSTDYNQPESGARTETSTDMQSSSYSWRDEDRESITREDLPAELLQTLDSDEYQGWENATIYKNKTTNDYMLVMQDNGTVKTFYFDKTGKSLSTQGASGSMQDQSSGASGTSGSYGTSDTSDTSSSSSSDMNTSGSGTSGTGTTGTGMSSESSTSGSYGTSGSGTSGSTTTDQTGTNSTQSSGTSSGTTTPTGTSGSIDQPNESASGMQTTEPSQSTSWNNEDRVIIVADDLPTSLRVTLEGDDQYKGWENSSLYRNRTTNEYMIEIRDGSNSKVYYFDKDGKVISNSGNNE